MPLGVSASGGRGCAGDAVAEKELGQRGHGLDGRSVPAESGGKDLGRFASCA